MKKKFLHCIKSGKETVMTIAETLERRGMLKCAYNKQREIARNLLLTGMDIYSVAEVTQLPPSEVKGL
jgi:hypothetical protein